MLILKTTDFAQVPADVVYTYVNESVQLSWDLTTLRRLSTVNFEVYLVTPTTGRLPVDYYINHWLPMNGHSSTATELDDHLEPVIQIDGVSESDAGLYSVEVNISWTVALTATQIWNNDSSTFSCHLVVLGLCSHHHAFSIPLAENTCVFMCDVCVRTKSSNHL